MRKYNIHFRILFLILAIGLSGCATNADGHKNLSGISKSQLVKRFGYPASISMITHSSQGAPGYEVWTYYERSSQELLIPLGIILTSSKSSFGRVVAYPADLQPDRILRMDDWDSFKAIFEAEAKSR